MTRVKTFVLIGVLVLTALLGSAGTATAQESQHPPANGGYYYTVHYGDTLSGIALWTYGNANAWQCIANANGLGNGNYIWAGQSLWLPTNCAAAPGSGGPRYHTVQYGETLSSLAWWYYGNYNYWPIVNANGIGNPHWIYAGQVLRIP